MRFNERLHFYECVFVVYVFLASILHGMSTYSKTILLARRGRGARATETNTRLLHMYFCLERLSTTSYVGIVQQIVAIILKLPTNGSF